MDITWYSSSSVLESQYAEMLLYWKSFQVQKGNREKEVPLSITFIQNKKFLKVGPISVNQSMLYIP